MTKRCDVLQWLEAQAQECATFVGFVAPRVEARSSREDFVVPDEGLIVIRDLGLTSEIGEIGLGAGNTIKDLTLRVAIEIYAPIQDSVAAEEGRDSLADRLGEVIECDPSLGGLVDDSSIDEANEEDFDELGLEDIAGLMLLFQATWSAGRTLG